MVVDSKDGGRQLKKPYHSLFLNMNEGQLRKPVRSRDGRYLLFYFRYDNDILKPRI